MIRNILVVLSVVVLAGCQNPYLLVLGPGATSWVLKVETDSEFTGIVNGIGVNGAGDRTYPITRPGCWTIRNTRHQGFIRAYAMPADRSSRDQLVNKYADRSTSAPFGVVANCF